jgi:hypothetical protein
MPQIARTNSDYQETGERIPTGISGSSFTLYQSALHSIQELQPGTGTTSKLLYQAAIRTLNFYVDFSEDPDLVRYRNLERYLNEVIREALLPTLNEIYNLLTWPEGWNGYDACAPKFEAVQYASHWIELFYLDIVSSGQEWIEPNVTASAEGEVVFEWRHGIKNLTIYIGNQSAEYVMDWGADINTEMEDGYANSPSIRQRLWKWLMS